MLRAWNLNEALLRDIPEVFSTYPPTDHVDKIEEAVEDGHEQIRAAEVHQEVIRYAAHPPVS